MSEATTVSLPWKAAYHTDHGRLSNIDYERANFDKLRAEKWPERPVMYDIGAHQGMYSTFLASLIGPTGIVYAFEPNPANFDLLCMNAALGTSDAPIVIVPMALGSKDEVSELRCNAGDWGSSQGQLVVGDKPDYVVPVPVRRLDSLNLPDPCFVKLDVEHWEVEVMKGGEQMLLRARPRMLIEIHDPKLGQTIIEWANLAGFDWEQSGATIPAAHPGVQEYLFLRPKEA